MWRKKWQKLRLINHLCGKNHGFEIQSAAWSAGRRHLQRKLKEGILKRVSRFSAEGEVKQTPPPYCSVYCKEGTFL